MKIKDMIRANEASRKSWVFVPENSDFSIQNLPFGIFSVGLGGKKVGVAIGNQILDLSALEQLGKLNGLGFDHSDFASSSLNNMMRKGKEAVRELRNVISDLLLEGSEMEEHAQSILVDQLKATMHLLLKLVIIPISIQVSSMLSMWDVCSEIQIMRYFPIGNIFP